MAEKKNVNKKGKNDKKEIEGIKLNNNFWAVVTFSIGIFVACVAFIKAGAVWGVLHNILCGIFGVAAYAIGFIIMYVAVMIAQEKKSSAVYFKLIEGAVLVALVCGILFLFTFPNGPEGKNVFEKLKFLYDSGVDIKGGGIVSIIFGWIMMVIFTNLGAKIILIILAFAAVMILSNISLLTLLRFIGKPFKKAAKSAKEKAMQKLNSKDKDEEEENARDGASVQEVLEKKNDGKRRVDIAKFIEDDEKENEDEFSFEKDLPSHPVVSKKKREEALVQDDRDDDSKELENIIKKAMSSKEKKEEKSKPKDRDIVKVYEEKNGQSTLFEKQNTTPVYQYPPIDLLNMPKNSNDPIKTRNEIHQNSETLVETLQSFGVSTRIIDIHRGPSVTRYELQPAAGVKVSKITGLADDIALNLAANGVRIEAPIPGKPAVGIEIANKTRDNVVIRELIDSKEFTDSKTKLSFPVGKDIEGNIVMGDISKMPHMLIAGTTGSGKSVFTNSIIMSILYHASPEEVKLILIDPKQVEFPIYNGIPHLLIPVVTEPRKAAGALSWAVTEMLRRYKIFSDNGVRDLDDYNKLAQMEDGLDPLPKIVIVIDELADLMMAAPKEVEDSICRIAQLARAAGMHMIIATQSPRVDIVTGLIKANIPSRVALKVSNRVDSGVILDETGAEKLLGLGDLLYKPVGLGKPVRIQGSYVASEEVKRVVEFLKKQSMANYDEKIIKDIEDSAPVPKGEKGDSASSNASSNSGDDMIDAAIEVLVEAGQASTSYLQRKLKLGYARAARIIDELEEMGIVGPSEGAKPRKVLLSKEQWLESKVRNSD